MQRCPVLGGAAADVIVAVGGLDHVVIIPRAGAVVRPFFEVEQFAVLVHAAIEHAALAQFPYQRPENYNRMSSAINMVVGIPEIMAVPVKVNMASELRGLNVRVEQAG